MSDRIRHFDNALKRLVVPPLVERGFIANLRLRDFRRNVSKGDRTFVQIISFQIGAKRMSGSFTVNLGVYCEGEGELQVSPGRVRQPEVGDCYWEMQKRLGFLFDPPRGAFAKWFRMTPAVPSDHWWRFDEGQAAIDRDMTKVRECLIGRGVPWLDQTTSVDAVHHAKKELAERQRALAARR